MEPISFAAGILSLGSVFSTCIEAFGYFQAAKSFARGYGILLVKLDVEKTRLLAWGKGIGLLDPVDEFDSPHLGAQDKVVRDCLENVRFLLQDAESLRYKYRMQANSTAATDKAIETVSRYNRFRTIIRKKSSQPSAMEKIIWAITTSKKFESLVSDVKGFVDSLKDILPLEKASDLQGQIKDEKKHRQCLRE
ncbi:MAG: hypothetical protein MMC33_007964 [Icmadophila ericetorum]|nr:hypothetical protein [Icmadophila ericetorum]